MYPLICICSPLISPQSLHTHSRVIFLNSDKKDKLQSSISRPRIDILSLQFKDPHLEYNYMHQPDYLLKYSVLLSWWVLVTLTFEHESNDDLENVHPTSYISFGIYSLVVLIIWYKQLCFWIFGPYKSNYTRFSCMLFQFIEEIQKNLIARLIIYVLTIMTQFSILADLMVGTMV